MPYGKSQFDYLRRLAERLGDTHRRLRAEGKEGIRAIGVLGGDAFDKLLVLRALKPAFPYAQFFTTDFDTALTTRGEREWTRNLIVASSLGSQLRRELQGVTPPFRSGYQTAAFLATQLAVAEVARVPTPKKTCSAAPAHGQTKREPLVVANAPAATPMGGERRTARVAANDTRRKASRRAAAVEQRRPSGWTAMAAPSGSAAQSAGAFVCDTRPAAHDAGAAEIASERGGDATFAHLDRNRLMRWFAEATVFEATRTGELLPLPRRRVDYSTKPSLCDGDILACDEIQSPARPLYPSLGAAARIGLAALLALMGIGVLAYAYVRRENLRFANPRRDHWSVDWALIGSLLIVCGLIALFWEEVALFLTQEGVGERIALFDGVSIWPSAAIAFGAMLASIRLIARACAMLDGNLDEIATEMALAKPNTILAKELQDMRNDSGWRRFRKMFLYRLGEERADLGTTEENISRGEEANLPSERKEDPSEAFCARVRLWLARLAARPATRSKGETRGESGEARGQEPAKPIKTICDIDKLWRNYVLEDRSRARLLRSGVASAVATLLLIAFDGSFASQWPPIRGDVARFVAMIGVIGEVFFIAMLVFVVLDASFCCLRFIQQLAGGLSKWPDETKAQFKRSFGESTKPSDESKPIQPSSPVNILNDMIDLKFIELRTKCVNGLVYYPFVMIAVIIVAQSTVFSPYPPSLVILVAEAAGLVAILVCMMAFRRAAEGARSAARAHILEAEIRTKGDGVQEAWRPEQLEKMLARLENMTDGAFGSFWRQPAIRALSAPVVSLGLTNLLELKTPLGF